jgi:O-antigen ligase
MMLSTFKKRIIGLFSLFIIFLTFLGMFALGPISKLGEIPAVKTRLYYWAAGICMGNSSPIFGIGFDRYGDWYRRCRPRAALNWAPDVTTDASHNIFIDYYVTGGFTLVLAFMLLLIATFRKIVVIYRSSQVSIEKTSILIAIFIAYLAQGVISINQIGLGIWGWIFMGLILGFPVEDRFAQSEKNKLENGAKAKRNTKTATAKLLIILVFILVSTLPPLITSQNFRYAVIQGDANKINESMFDWPVDADRFKQGIIFLEALGSIELAKSSAVKAVAIFPDNYSLWRIYESLFRGEQEEIIALKNLKRLDPGQ